MRPPGVVQKHHLINRRQQLFLALKRTAETVFLFQYPVQPFGTGVFITARLLMYTYRKSAGLKFFNIIMSPRIKTKKMIK
jgi:hypothetical protein